MPTTALPPSDRPGVTYEQARALLAARGVVRSIRTLQRWVSNGLLTVKRITCRTVILFQDEVEDLAKKGNPYE